MKNAVITWLMYVLCISCVHIALSYQILQERFLINKSPCYHPHMFAPSHFAPDSGSAPIQGYSRLLIQMPIQSNHSTLWVGVWVGRIGSFHQFPSLLRPIKWQSHRPCMCPLSTEKPTQSLAEVICKVTAVPATEGLVGKEAATKRSWKIAALLPCCYIQLRISCNHTAYQVLVRIESSVKTWQYCPNAHKLECFWLCASNTLTTTTPCPGRAFVRGRTWALCTWRKCLDVEPDGDLLAWMYGCMKYAKWDWFSLQKYSTSFLLLLWGEAKKKKTLPLELSKSPVDPGPVSKEKVHASFCKIKASLLLPFPDQMNSCRCMWPTSVWTWSSWQLELSTRSTAPPGYLQLQRPHWREKAINVCNMPAVAQLQQLVKQWRCW